MSKPPRRSTFGASLRASTQSFDASDFTSSPLCDAPRKARFASQFTRFVAAGCPSSKFPTWFFNHLRNTFGVPRHWSRAELHSRWFSDIESIAAFARRAVTYVPSGRADRGYADVEMRPKQWFIESGAADELNSRLNEATEARERAVLRALLTRYPDEADRANRRDPPPSQTDLFPHGLA
jgi:hypothetical protein